jgi:hypothetical protein
MTCAARKSARKSPAYESEAVEKLSAFWRTMKTLVNPAPVRTPTTRRFRSSRFRTLRESPPPHRERSGPAPRRTR